MRVSTANPFEHGEALVFSAHPDDEITGTKILKKIAARNPDGLSLAFATNGENGVVRSWNPVKNKVDESRNNPPEILGTMRRHEALIAAGYYGVRNPEDDVRFFDGLSDDGLAEPNSLIAMKNQLVEIVRQRKSRHVLVPMDLHEHNDHGAVVEGAKLAVGELEAEEYEVALWGITSSLGVEHHVCTKRDDVKEAALNYWTQFPDENVFNYVMEGAGEQYDRLLVFSGLISVEPIQPASAPKEYANAGAIIL